MLNALREEDDESAREARRQRELEQWRLENNMNCLQRLFNGKNRTKGVIWAAVMSVVLFGFAVAGFVVAAANNESDDLSVQCPGNEGAAFVSNVSPTKWLFVFSGTALAGLLFVSIVAGGAIAPGSDMCHGFAIVGVGLVLVFHVAWSIVGLVLVSATRFCGDAKDAVKTTVIACSIWSFVQVFIGCPVFIYLFET